MLSRLFTKNLWQHSKRWIDFKPGSLKLSFKNVSFYSVRAFSTTNSNMPSDLFVHGNSGAYLEELYGMWSKDPTSVDPTWAEFFEKSLPEATQFASRNSDLNFAKPSATSVASMHEAVTNPICEGAILEHMKVQLLVRAYQVRGHHRSNLDPLGILKPDLDYYPAPELDPEYYGLREKHMDEEFILSEGVLPHFRRPNKPTMTLREILTALRETYCNTIGIEYTHIPERDRCDWIRQRIEQPVKYSFSKVEKMRILDRLVWSDSFEKFVHSKYPGEKRFGLEGCEALIPGMKALIDQSVEEHNVESIVIGMSHRGRLNVLSNVVRKPNESIFCEFNGELDTEVGGSGDVKYHLGMNYERPTPNGKRVHLSLVANPSHLEAVNPVVQGKTKALQFYTNDTTASKIMGVLVHGDAAFAGQGVVYESLGLADLPSYSTGGTVHLIINNQIGFTTDPRFARSTPYCTAIAKAFSAPIIHVNGDDVEAVVWACTFAADYRKQYKKDVIVDIVCYRRAGHNEFDEPSFTQPRMYAAITKKTRSIDIYIEKLLAEGLITKADIEATQSRIWNILEGTYANSKTYKPTVKEWLTSSWNGFKSPKEIATEVSPAYDTGVNEENLRSIGESLCKAPEDFVIHKGLVKILDAKRKSIETGEGLDMGTCEALAFGTLLLEGNHVRLSGQDVERGTFSHRHAVLHDQVTERTYIPLTHLDASQSKFTVCNSSLSEYGILGFELGYSLVNPRSLIMWEAQFGDFCNGAQIIIDQFLVSGERKWLQRSGLTLLLPHGYDGAGPEHSSGRMERFLQMCDDDPSIIPVYEPSDACRQIQDSNIQIVVPSTPASYFHVLRRQVHRDFRKPLVVFTSKALLRHPLARSSFADIGSGTRFARLLPEAGYATPATTSTTKDDGSEEFALLPPDQIKTVIFCAGQVYYHLLKTRELNRYQDVVLLRLEQISPFPFDLVMDQLHRYPHATRILWAQEEPLNMGAATYVKERFLTVMNAMSKNGGSSHKKSGSKLSSHSTTNGNGNGPHSHSPSSTSHAISPAIQQRLFEVVARPPSAAVATGLKKLHHLEEESLFSRVFHGKIKAVTKLVNGLPLFHA